MAKDKEFERKYKLERLKRTKIRKQVRINKKGVPHKCIYCKKQSGSLMINPYYYDMYGRKDYEVLCSSCYSDIAGDI